MSWTPLIFLTEVACFSLLVCLVHSLKGRFGLAPLYVLVGLFEAFLFVVNKAEPQIKTELFLVEPRSIYLIFLTSMLVSVVLVYVLEGTAEARRLIVAIVILYITHGIIDIVIAYHASHPPPGSPDLSEIDLVWYSTPTRLASLVAMVADFLVIIIVYQFVHNRARALPLAVPLFIAVIAALFSDAVVFKLVRHWELSQRVFFIGAKAQAGIAAGIPAAIYFSLQLRRHPGAVRKGIMARRTLSIIALQRRVSEMERRLVEEKRRYKLIRNTFGRYVSKDVVDTIVADPSSLDLGGELRG